MAFEELPADDLAVVQEMKRNAMNTAFGFDALWVATGFKLLRVDPASNEITEIALKDASQKQRRIAVGEGAVWIPDVGAKTVFKVDPEAREVVAGIPLNMLSTQGSIGVGEGSLWVVSADGFEKTLVRIDAATGDLEASIALPSAGVGVMAAYGAVWVTSNMGDELHRIDPATNTVASTVKMGDGPLFMTAGFDSIWVHNQTDALVYRVDPANGEVLATIETGLPSGLADIDAGGGSIWINTPYNVPLAQIDPATDTLVRRYAGRTGGDTLRFGAGSLWIGGATLRRVTPPG